jgi:acetyltransferase-like isoleucine patch superfamily enzyme
MRDSKPGPGRFVLLSWKLRTFTRLVAARLRMHVLTMFGMRSGGKCMIDRGVRLDRPWTVRLGTRVTMEANVWIKSFRDYTKVAIGDHAFLGRGVELDVSESLTIGAYTLIAPNVFITDHGHKRSRANLIVEQGCDSRPVVIGEDVWIGTAAVILPGVSIGRGAIVGAGAVVAHDIPEYEIWAGVPARRVGCRE